MTHEGVARGVLVTRNVLTAVCLGCLSVLVAARLFSAPSNRLSYLVALCGAVFAFIMLVLGRFDPGHDAPRSLGAIDIGIVIIWLTDVVSLAGSAYPRNSFERLADMSILVIIFVLFRVVTSIWNIAELCTAVFALGGGAFAGWSIIGSIRWATNLQSLGFTDLNAFKATAPVPLRFPILHDWATILLIVLSFAVSASGLRILAESGLARSAVFVVNVLTLAALALTFVRGVYIAVAVFYGVLIALSVAKRLRTGRRMLQCVCAAGVACLLISFAAPLAGVGMLNTLFGRSVSQARSTSGRLSIWSGALATGESHFVLGVGSGNFALEAIHVASERSDAPLVVRSLSLPVQVFVENGLLGLAAYAVVFCVVLRYHYRHLVRGSGTERFGAAVEFAVLIGLLVREATYSTLVTSPQASVLFCSLLAISAQSEGDDAVGLRHDWPLSWSAVRWTVGVALACCGVVFLRELRYVSAAGDMRIGSWELAEGNSANARRAFDAALAKDPNNAYYHLAKALAIERCVTASARPYSRNTESRGFGGHTASLISAALMEYRSVLSISPPDDGVFHSIGWLYYYAGDESRAEENVRTAIAINGGEALYHISLAIFLERRGAMQSAHSEYVTAVVLAPSLVESEFFRELKGISADLADQIFVESLRKLRLELGQGDDPVKEAKLASLLLTSGNTVEAECLLRKALGALPQLPAAWRKLGRILRNRGDLRGAQAAYEKAEFFGR